MEELEDVLDFDETDSGYKAFRKLLCGLIIASVIFVAVLILLLCFYHSRQVKLEQQLEQQTETLEHQNQVIDGLMSKRNESGSLFRESVPVITSELLKEEIGALSELVTRQYIYTNADKRGSDETWIFGWTRPFSSKSILITYDGIIKAGIDLSQVVVDVDEKSHVITVTLPKSTITDNNIPQETITVVEAKDGLFNEVTFDDYNQFVSEQKIVMEQKVKENGFLQEADEEARTIVKSFLALFPGTKDYKLIVE